MQTLYAILFSVVFLGLNVGILTFFGKRKSKNDSKDASYVELLEKVKTERK